MCELNKLCVFPEKSLWQSDFLLREKIGDSTTIWKINFFKSTRDRCKFINVHLNLCFKHTAASSSQLSYFWFLFCFFLHTFLNVYQTFTNILSLFLKQCAVILKSLISFIISKENIISLSCLLLLSFLLCKFVP